MNADKLPQQRRPSRSRGDICVVVAAAAAVEDRTPECVDSIRANSGAGIEVVGVRATAAAVNAAIAAAAPADVVVLAEPCAVTAGWLTRLHAAAHADTVTATASALVDRGGPLALDTAPGDRRGTSAGHALDAGAGDDLDEMSRRLAARTKALRPRLEHAVGPCVYLRRDAIELVGALDEELPLPWALEYDLPWRCVLSGLAHVAADDVLVSRLDASAAERGPPPRVLLDRHPQQPPDAPVAAAAVLDEALAAVRPRASRLAVTIDARALDGAVTGTQVHILELIRALVRTGALELRLLVRERRIDPAALELLRGLPATTLLDEAEIDASTPVSAVVHRPQQAFAAEDVEIATALGARMVISQLDLIAYRNPGYFPGRAAWHAYRRAGRHGLAASERVVVFSEHTRLELLGDALVEDERIRIVAPGLDHGAGAERRRPAALGDAADAPFLLCLGTDFRHKNRVFALRLLEALRRRHDWSGVLVLAGTHIPHGSSRALEDELLAATPHLRDVVVDLGAVTEEEKAWLVSHARAVVYPSVYEGFGLVPFESALLGTPCVFAPQSSLAYVAPPGTASVVPWDADASADAAIALLGETAERRGHLHALAQAAGALSWDRAAAAMVEVYREAVEAPVRAAAVLGRDAVARERELTAAHLAVVERLIAEREHAQRMYDELNAEVGSGLSLIGPNGALPADAQNALLALSARPALSRTLYGTAAALFRAARALARALPGGARGGG